MLVEERHGRESGDFGTTLSADGVHRSGLWCETKCDKTCPESKVSTFFEYFEALMMKEDLGWNIPSYIYHHHH
jgi:hypothetical protein